MIEAWLHYWRHHVVFKARWVQAVVLIVLCVVVSSWAVFYGVWWLSILAVFGASMGGRIAGSSVDRGRHRGP